MGDISVVGNSYTAEIRNVELVWVPSHVGNSCTAEIRNVELLWVPSHVRLKANGTADLAAKDVLSRPVVDIHLLIW